MSGVPLITALPRTEPNLFRPPAPQPRRTPLGPLGMLAVLRRNPIETWTQAHFQHFILAGNTILGPAAVVSAPAGVRQILVDNAANYPKDALQRRILAPGLGDGLLTAEGARWRLQRHALAPLFSPKTVPAFAPAMIRAADDCVARWQRRRDGTIVDVQKSMARVTLEALQHTIFGDGLGCAPEEFMRALSDYFATIGRLDPLDLLDFPAWLPRLTRMRSRKALGFFDAMVETLLEQRERTHAENRTSPRDLLTLLLEAQNRGGEDGLSEAEVRANIVTFVAAGQETTANALTWSLFLLACSEEWQERLAGEAIRAVAPGELPRLQELIETRAVVEEAMRLYPPVASLSREAQGPDDILGRRIRKGALVMIVPWILHRHRRLWDDPDCFDPRRFLPGRREAIDRFAYLPFGAGPRVCIGAAFAMQEATIVLATIMRHFTLRPVASHAVKPVQHITLRPQGGMPLIVMRRKGIG